jgi:threonine synthase
MMRYESTRGNARAASSLEAVLEGLAPDGGLYTPSEFPRIDLRTLGEGSYAEAAAPILSPFFPELGEARLLSMIDAAYAGKFEGPEPIALSEARGFHFLELYHGPTLAFKDMALSFMPSLLDAAKEAIDPGSLILILTATSGDTGKAALEAFSDVEGTAIAAYYPSEGMSRIQKLQMTTQRGRNVLACGVHGNFDDAQKGVKEIFGDQAFAFALKERGIRLSSANSINIARLLPQVAYYCRAYGFMAAAGKVKRGQPIDICVPTGNFGNILAAHFARLMGLPIGTLVCASNPNKVLTDFFGSARYDANRPFHVTSSPSMDILVSSNLERLLYLASGRDAGLVASLMEGLASKGSYEVSGRLKEGLSGFSAYFASEEETLATIGEFWREADYLMDTHTAVAARCAERYAKDSGAPRPILVASTASPFKFPHAVLKALGKDAAGLDDFAALRVLSESTSIPIPGRVAELERLEELHRESCDPGAMRAPLLRFIEGLPCARGEGRRA